MEGAGEARFPLRWRFPLFAAFATFAAAFAATFGAGAAAFFGTSFAAAKAAAKEDA